MKNIISILLATWGESPYETYMRSPIGKFLQNGIVSWPIIVLVIMTIVLITKKSKHKSVSHKFMIAYAVIAFILLVYSVDRYCIITKGYTFGLLSNIVITLMMVPLFFLIKYIIAKNGGKPFVLNKVQKGILVLSIVLLICHVELRITNSVILNAKLSKYRTTENYFGYYGMIDNIKLHTRKWSFIEEVKDDSLLYVEEVKDDSLLYVIHHYGYYDSRATLEVDVNGDKGVYKTSYFNFDNNSDYIRWWDIKDVLYESNHSYYFLKILGKIWKGFVQFYFYSYMW